jgi:nitroreductase/NAD-dependent dihydropyrimidine dehydrogenase PreA subunit
MNQLMVDQVKCVGCGKCQERCGFKKVIGVNGTGKAAFKKDRSECIECYHCIMVCPNDAIRFSDNESISVAGVNKETSPVLTRHSCRAYRADKIEKEVLARLLGDANMAPRAYIDFKERKYIVATGDTLLELRAFLLKKIERHGGLFRMLLKIPFLPRALKNNLKNMAWCFTGTTEANKEREQLFQGAPAVVLISGPAQNVLSKVNSNCALLQLMVLAEERGLGTCWSGYIEGYSNDISRFLELPKGEKVFCGAMIGYPVAAFTRYVRRNDTVILWL